MIQIGDQSFALTDPLVLAAIGGVLVLLLFLILLVLPADHLIQRPESFREAVRTAEPLARAGRGADPRAPRLGEPLGPSLRQGQLRPAADRGRRGRLRGLRRRLRCSAWSSGGGPRPRPLAPPLEGFCSLSARTRLRSSSAASTGPAIGRSPRHAPPSGGRVGARGGCSSASTTGAKRSTCCERRSSAPSPETMVKGKGSKCRTERVLPPGRYRNASFSAAPLSGFNSVYRLRASSIASCRAFIFFTYFSDSMTMAMPCPTPMHIVHSASLPPPVCSWSIAVIARRAPLIPSG